LPTAFDIYSETIAKALPDDQVSVEDFIECFDDTLEEMTPERCLRIIPDSDDVVEVLTEGAMCLTEAKHNATRFITNFLGFEDQTKVNPCKKCW
jgi:hypothetical protein